MPTNSSRLNGTPTCLLEIISNNDSLSHVKVEAKLDISSVSIYVLYGSSCFAAASLSTADR